MINYFDRIAPFLTVNEAKEVLETTFDSRRWLNVWGLASDTLLDQYASCNEAVCPVRVVMGNGETWIVDSQGCDEFEITADSTPVARQRAAAQLGNLVFADFGNKRPRDPDPVAVFARTDDRDGRSGVVVVFRSWLHTEAFIRVPSPKGDLADGDESSFLRLYGA